MIKTAGQFLAIVALMASAINAQCALSCSLQAVGESAAHMEQAVRASHGHACCPERNAPANHGRDQQQRPCPIPVLIAGDLTSPIQYSFTQLFNGPALVSIDASLPFRNYANPDIFDSARMPDIPAFAILRI